MIEENIRRRLIEISEEYDLLLLILFGSRATEKYSKDSDYDFGFYTKTKLSVKKENELFNEIISLLKNEKVDLININSNFDNKLRFEIFMKGELIYQKYDGLFSEMRGKIFGDYNDFNFFQRDNKLILHEKIRKLMEQDG